MLRRTLLLAAVPALLAAESPIVLSMVINAQGGCGPAKLDFAQVQPDGSRSAEMYRVPTGKRLIVTGVDWTYNGGAAGQTKALAIYIENLSDSGKRTAVYRSPIRLNTDGAGGASEHLTIGFEVSDQVRACPNVEHEQMGTLPRLLNVILRGRLE
jgi:hypothetical protein